MTLPSSTKLASLLPHGENIIGISEVVSLSYNSIVVRGLVGACTFMLTDEGRLMPEAILELVGQAAALGNNLSLSAKNKRAGEREGVIMRVRHMDVAPPQDMPGVGESLSIAVQWSEPLGMAFELTGEVTLCSKGTKVGTLSCSVLELR